MNRLYSLINNDYIFIDLPYYSNIGDTLIWRGTEEFLKMVPHNCLLRASFQTFQYPELPDDVIILMMGGGNWGDLYFNHSHFRREVVKRYPNNKIIIFPQTVYYDGFNIIRYDSNLFRSHKKLYICARDKYSYDFLKHYGFGKNILLVPDMAFCIKTDFLREFCKSPERHALLFKRKDKEETNVNSIIHYLQGKEYDMYDWPLYEEKDPLLDKLNHLIQDDLFSEADDYAINVYLPTRVKQGVEFISRYTKVYSNRLHGAILAILLDKDVTVIDNSYGKNSQYYDTWLRDLPNVHIIRIKRKLHLKRWIKRQAIWLLTIYDRIIG